KGKSPLPKCRFRLSVTRRPPQRSVTRRPFQLSVMQTPSDFRKNQARQRRNASAAVPKWQACCSEHSAATEEFSSRNQNVAALCLKEVRSETRSSGFFGHRQSHSRSGTCRGRDRPTLDEVGL